MKKLFLREGNLVVLGAVILAALLEWPSLRHAGTTVPKDLGDPLAQAYLLSWPGHILPINPGQLWNTNTFFPEPDSFAYSDSLLGYAPFSFIGEGSQSAIVRINLLCCSGACPVIHRSICAGPPTGFELARCGTWS